MLLINNKETSCYSNKISRLIFVYIVIKYYIIFNIANFIFYKYKFLILYLLVSFYFSFLIFFYNFLLILYLVHTIC